MQVIPGSAEDYEFRARDQRGSGWSSSPGSLTHRGPRRRACLQSRTVEQKSRGENVKPVTGKGTGLEANVFLVLKELQSSENLLRRRKYLSLKPFKGRVPVTHWLPKMLEGSSPNLALSPVHPNAVLLG